MIAAEFGNIRMMGNEVLQEMRELVSLAQQHVAAHQVLVHHAQVVVVAEGVHVHEVPHLVTLLGEEHGELEGVDSHTTTTTTTTTTTQTPTSNWNWYGTTSQSTESCLFCFVVHVVTTQARRCLLLVSVHNWFVCVKSYWYNGIIPGKDMKHTFFLTLYLLSSYCI